MAASTPATIPRSAPSPVVIGPHPTDRRLFRLESRLWLPQPPEVVFPFFADAFNLEAITPPWLHFHVLTPRPIAMRSGVLIDYRLRLRGIPIVWRSLIDDWQPPLRFVDQMQRGPYRHWRHLHTFEPRDGGTDVVDQVDYGVPGGAIVNRWFVAPDLRRIFEYRRERLREIFGDSSA